jgi:hypothetical protein
MTRVTTNNTNKASGDTSPFSRRRNHHHFEDDALIMLLIRGLSLPVTADRIPQRNSSGTYVPPRSGLLVDEAMEELFDLTSSRDSSGTSPTTNSQRMVRHFSLDHPSGDTRREDISAILSQAYLLASESCRQLVDDDDDDDDESDDL